MDLCWLVQNFLQKTTYEQDTTIAKYKILLFVNLPSLAGAILQTGLLSTN